MEGMVAKRRDSIYRPGIRTKDWLKIKRVYHQDFVVGGYTKGSGSRSQTFGSLLVGCYEGEVLRYAGRVGSGFDMDMLEALLEPLELLGTDQCPFVSDRELARTEAGWVSPRIVVHVKFAEWTDEDRLRAPVFLRLQTDVDPASVRRKT